MVAAILPLGFSAQAVGNKALQLNGTSQYATVGNATQLRLSQFTLETWFKWNGGGDHRQHAAPAGSRTSSR